MKEEKKEVIMEFLELRKGEEFVVQELVSYIKQESRFNPTIREVAQELRGFPVEKEVVRNWRGNITIYKSAEEQ